MNLIHALTKPGRKDNVFVMVWSGQRPQRDDVLIAYACYIWLLLVLKVSYELFYTLLMFSGFYSGVTLSFINVSNKGLKI